MQLRMLGAHQGEARGIRFMSMIVDNRLVIDAGGLTSALTLEEQAAVEALLLTHPHLDHIKDLPMFAYNVWAKHSLQVYCTEPTETAIRRYFFNDAIWPDMTVTYPGVHPVVFNRVEAGQPFDLLGYRISPIEMPHAV